MDEYITKPIRLEALRQRLQQYSVPKHQVA